MESGRTGGRPGVAVRGMTRVYRALEQAAGDGRRCPSNRELCDQLGIEREARITQILARLRGRKLIDIEWSGPDGGARRVAIRATGATTGWSRMGPEAGVGEDDEPRISTREGMAALGRALRRAGGRFCDMSRAEARSIARDTPPDAGLPERPAPSSYMTSPLGALQQPVPDEGNDPFIERRQ